MRQFRYACAGFQRTAIAVVPNLGHPMIGRKEENGFVIPVELGNQALGVFHDVIDDLDVFHVFLIHQGAK